ncbi:MAG TPA: HEAT repeat domain-containing protein [Vicinamibacterales bacterium]|nr:HEAT repeat domain-containing protein [Vicinamibacterales bacterium]
MRRSGAAPLAAASLRPSHRVIGGICAICVICALGCGPKAAPVVVPTPPPPSADQKLGWILQLEDQRVARGEAAGEDMVAMLSDAQAHIRRRAALGVGRARIAEAVEPLSAMLAKEPDPEVRQMAAFALGLIGNPGAATALTTALANPDPLLQGRAAEALGKIGDKSSASAIATMIAAHVNAGVLKDIAPDDVSYPKSAPVEAVRLGLYALVQLGAFNELSSATLDSSGAVRSNWWPVAYAFQRINNPGAAPVLTALLQTEGQITRAFAARGLGVLKHAAAAPALETIVADAAQPKAVRIQAVRALAAMSAHAAAPSILKMVVTPKTVPTLQMEGVVALGQLRSQAALDVLLELGSASWPTLRSAALVAIARIDPETFIGVLAGLDPDPHWSVRAALAGALGELPGKLGEARLTTMLTDDDQRVIPAVLTAVAALNTANAKTVLVERLRSEDPVVRMAAANGLARIKASDQVPALATALEASASDNTYVARAAILSAMAALDRATAVPALQRALADPEWAIRLRAAELLRGIDGAAAPPPVTPAPPPLAPELSAIPALMAPAYTPMAYIDTENGSIQIELAVVDAPRTVANFTALVRKGFFNNIPWHRVVADFVIQGGDPRGDGEGGPGYTIRDEINQRPYVRGTVGMALDWADTGGSQFFITHSPQPHLDGRYTVFGQVVTGMDVVDSMQQWDAIRTIRVWDGVNWIGSDEH